MPPWLGRVHFPWRRSARTPARPVQKQDPGGWPIKHRILGLNWISSHQEWVKYATIKVVGITLLHYVTRCSPHWSTSYFKLPKLFFCLKKLKTKVNLTTWFNKVGDISFALFSRPRKWRQIQKSVIVPCWGSAGRIHALRPWSSNSQRRTRPPPTPGRGQLVCGPGERGRWTFAVPPGSWCGWADSLWRRKWPCTELQLSSALPVIFMELL